MRHPGLNEKHAEPFSMPWRSRALLSEALDTEPLLYSSSKCTAIPIV